MLKNFWFLIVGLLILGCQPVTPVPQPTQTPLLTTATLTPAMSPTPSLQPEVKAYLEEVLGIMREYSYYRDAVDWQQMEMYAWMASVGKTSTEDAYPVVRMLLAELGDKHGYLMPPQDYEHYTEMTIAENTAPEVELLDSGLGYIMLPSFASGDMDTVRAYATQLQSSIAEIDTDDPCGWIVDLRRNGGGNMWAMLAGIGPILGEGMVGGWDDGRGNQAIWKYEEGKAILDDTVIVEVFGEAYHLKHPNPPVAVLTDQPTTSSGEAIAVAFRGRIETRSFGGPTWGLPSAIEGFVLSDQSMLGLTVSFFMDRNEQVYTGSIEPDQKIRLRTNPILSSGEIPEPAIIWLLDQPACQP